MPGSWTLQSRDLIASARLLIDASQGRPSQAVLRRAMSTAYYALFHHLARACADLMVGGAGAARSKEAWRRTYRALNHGSARNAFAQDSVVSTLPKSLQDFADAFVVLQAKRNLADYDPFARFSKSGANAAIDTAVQNIDDFDTAQLKDRRAFCALVLFAQRKER